MTEKTIIKNTSIVNEEQITVADLLIDNGLMHSIGQIIDRKNVKIVDGTGKHLFLGIIDGQVYFRELGLTHKGTLYTESKAAIGTLCRSFLNKD